MSVIVVDSTVCPICGKRFSNKGRVVYHIRRKHEREAYEKLTYEILRLLRSNKYLTTHQIIQILKERYPEFNKMDSKKRNREVYKRLKTLYMMNLVEYEYGSDFVLWRAKYVLS